MATNYDINYDDKRFTDVETAKTNALNEVDKTYGEMISQSDSYFDKQIAEAQKYADTQTALQNEQLKHTEAQINQQKDQAHKDYIKEQTGAYVDWQKQSDQYGANAEKIAAGGLTNTGFSESSQVSMYNTYQNRVATARESYNRAVLNYDNAIKDAQLQNSSALAEIAYNALQTQLELSLQGFQYKNSLIIEKANKRQEIDNTYYSRYQDVLSQINQENALAEEIRQYNASLALEQAKFNYEKEKDKAAKIVRNTGGTSIGTQKQTNQQRIAAEPENNVYDNYDIDYDSLNAAGYSRIISESEMARLVNLGVLTYKIVGNKIVFSKGENSTTKGRPTNIIDKFYAFK